jgi:hypothetical protein
VSGVLRAGCERFFLIAEPVDDRLTPFEVTVPLHLQCHVQLDIPSGYTAEPITGSAPKLDPRFVASRSQCRVEGRQAVLEFDCRLPAGRFGPSEYGAYRTTMSHVLATLEREVVLRMNPR